MLLSPPPPSALSPPPLAPPPAVLREAERGVFAFYVLVRDGAPVWRLEEARRLEVRVWDGGRGQLAPLSPGQALVYALVHDRSDYAAALLRRHGLAALTPEPCAFCTRSVGPVHLRLAVRYDRQEALRLILDTLTASLSPGDVSSYLDSRAFCSHLDGGDAAVAVAVAMGRSRCLLMLLASGAAATGLEAGLRRLEAGPEAGRGAEREALRCVYFLLLFGHAPSPRPLEAGLRGVLGEPLFHWLSGRAPPTLLLHALRSIARTAPESITKLPPGLL
ncbi:ankyrin repeat domain-containing protein 9-like [Boleophthalmus pectinirostris]|uniref:ankyrin repeat domain-containing protein 9-like n=1 Tax=Boleophthalmus pectinirostris TaxID=150288 RepID=UPI002432AC5C|nr:ankyrin repeat domain-containing protein 9-like [Boleophthalmus pectinirostris]